MTTQIHEEQISGVVERITFHSIETGWSVLKVAPFNSPSTIIPIIIHQAQVFAGASMKFFGNWINHPKYGEQFKATKVLEIKPASSAALEKYLGCPKYCRKKVKSHSIFLARTSGN